MPKRPYSLKIKERFIQAIDLIAKENYPEKKEVDILKVIGITPSNYYRLKASANNYPTLDNCAALCEEYNISHAWLHGGKGLMRSKPFKEWTAKELIRESLRMLEKNKST